MPSIPTSSNALWQCLYPTAASRLAKRSLLYGLQYRLPRHGRLHGHKLNCPFIRPHTTPTLHQPVNPIGTCSSVSFACDSSAPQREGAPQLLSPADVTGCYEALDASSRAADYQKVQKHVESLVVTLGQRPDARIYNASILANLDTKYGSASEVASLLQEMEEESIPPDAGTYRASLRVLAVHPDHLLRVSVLDSMRQRWYSLTQEDYHDIIVGLVRERQIELALQYLEEMQKNAFRVRPWLHDLMVHSLCNLQEFDEALRLMRDRYGLDGEPDSTLFEDGVPQDTSANVWHHLLKTAARAMHYEATVFAYNAQVSSKYLYPSAGTCNNILACAARHGDTNLATSVFGILSSRSGNPIQLYHYEGLLETYANSGDLSSAVHLLSVMQSAGHTPVIASTRPILAYLKRSVSRLTPALNELERLRDEGKPVLISAINIVLEGFIHFQHLPGAMHIYDTIPAYSPSPAAPWGRKASERASLKPDTRTFNILLRGCSYACDKPKALALIRDMRMMNVPWDALTHDRIVLVCLNSDDSLDDTWKYVHEMSKQGLSMRDGTVNLLAKKAFERGDERISMLLRENGGTIERVRLERIVKSVRVKVGAPKLPSTDSQT